MAATTGMNRSENKAELKCWAEALELSSNAVPRSMHPASKRWRKVAKAAALLKDTGITIPLSFSALRCFVSSSHLHSPEFVNTP
jgi:hypothetical protein